jgi:hypothetical protein
VKAKKNQENLGNASVGSSIGEARKATQKITGIIASAGANNHPDNYDLEINRTHSSSS